MPVGAIDELLVALSRVSGVGDDREVRITVLAELTNDLRIIELVGSQEFLRVLVSIHFDLSHSVMDSRDLDVLRDTVLEPTLQDGDLVSLLEFIDQLLHGDSRSDDFEDTLDVALLALEVNEGTKHNRDGLGVLANLEEIDLDVFGEVILVEVASEFVVLLVGIAEEDDRLGIGKFQLQKDVLDLDWIVAITLAADDLLDRSELSAFGGSLDVLVMDLFVSSRVDDCTQEEEDTIE